MNFERLLDSQEIERLRHQARQLPAHWHSGNSRLSGPFISPQRGSGMELEDLRPYQTGDDVRHIAWRASARSALPISKVFRAEQQQRILLLVEQHPGMGFASRGELKAAVASRASSLICFAALNQGAEVGGILARDKSRFFDASKSIEQTLAFIGAINQAPGQHPTRDSARHLAQLQRLAHRDDRIYLISDFQGWDTRLKGLLNQLSEQHRVHAMQIVDQGEQELPAIGKLRLRSPFDGREQVIDTNNAQLRRQYAETMAQRQTQLDALLRGCGIYHQQLHTDDDIFHGLPSTL